MGHPALRRQAEPLSQKEIADPETALFIDSMIATMREYNGAGLAAPQVHLSKQIVVIEAQSNSRYPNGEQVPLTVLINPKITSFSDKMQEGWEGCLSVAKLWGRVKRSCEVTVEALNRYGTINVINAEGFFAVVLQHEIDHLYGKLFVDRMDDLSSLCFSSEYRRYHSG
ncbi:MAG: peptide deformylase [bacterium]|nr:MAG: peptide deformylase [bacterium]